MQESKFITLLKTLNKQELRAFGLYLNRLYPGKKIQLKVFDFIRTFSPSYTAAKLDYPAVIKLLSKGKAIPKRTVTDSLSDLYILLLEFLHWQDLKTNKIQRDIKTISILKDRNLDDFAYALSNKVKTELANQKIQDEWHFLQQLLINHELFFISRSTNLKGEIDNLEEYNKHLDFFFILSKLKLGVESKSRKNILGNESFAQLNEQIDELLKSQADNSVLLLDIYREVFILLDKKNKTSYKKVKALILKHTDELSKRDLKTLFTYLINYSAIQIREGKTTFFKEVFEWSKLGIENKALFENNYIPSARFINIVDVACKLKEFEWLENFISEYTIYLESSLKNDTLLVSRARLAFAKGEFENVITTLSTTNFKNLYFEFRARSLLLRSYVELKQNKDFIINYCVTFEQYLRRKTAFSDAVIAGYRNMVKMIKLLSLKKNTKKELYGISKSMKQLICKDWINEQIKKQEP